MIMQNNKRWPAITAFVLILVALIYQSILFSYNYGYSLAKSEIRAKLEKEGIISPLPDSLFYLVGQVTKVDIGNLTMEAVVYRNYDPLFNENQKKDSVLVRLIDNTEIIKRTTLLEPIDGQIYLDERILLVDIKPDDQVGFLATENVLKTNNFQVSKVVVLE